MKILIACEFSGIVREAFKKAGHDVWSCDLLPTEIPGQHIQDDVLKYLTRHWDLMIAHPPCTHLAVSGARWFRNKETEQEEALEFVLALSVQESESQTRLSNPGSSVTEKPKQLAYG